MPDRESLNEFLSALFVLTCFKQNDREIVVSRRRVGRRLKLFERARKISAACKHNAEVVEGRGRFRIQFERAAELDFGSGGVVLEKEVVAEIVVRTVR